MLIATIETKVSLEMFADGQVEGIVDVVLSKRLARALRRLLKDDIRLVRGLRGGRRLFLEEEVVDDPDQAWSQYIHRFFLEDE